MNIFNYKKHHLRWMYSGAIGDGIGVRYTFTVLIIVIRCGSRIEMVTKGGGPQNLNISSLLSRSIKSLFQLSEVKINDTKGS